MSAIINRSCADGVDAAPVRGRPTPRPRRRHTFDALVALLIPLLPLAYLLILSSRRLANDVRLSTAIVGALALPICLLGGTVLGLNSTREKGPVGRTG